MMYSIAGTFMKSGEITVSQETIDDDIIITSNVAGDNGEAPAQAPADEETVSEAVEN